MYKEISIFKNNIEYIMLYDDFNQFYLDQGNIFIGGDGYAILYKDKKYYRINKLFIFGFENYFNISPDIIVDHKNRKILDNTMENLRIVNKQLNEYNEKPLRKNNTSGFKGISFDQYTNKWIAQIQYNGHNIKIGRYKNKDDAIVARLEAELLFCGLDYAPQRHLLLHYGVFNKSDLPKRIFELKEKYNN